VAEAIDALREKEVLTVLAPAEGRIVYARDTGGEMVVDEFIVEAGKHAGI
jgi:hypothetical protein